MKPKLLLRIAAGIMFLHLLGHMVGASTWKENPDPAVKEVIQGMEQNQFMFMGARQSLAGHHDGYGYAGALALLFFCAVLWIVSAGEASAKLENVRLIFVTTAILLLWGILELIYFFPFAAAFTLTSSALSAYALVGLKRA